MKEFFEVKPRVNVDERKECFEVKSRCSAHDHHNKIIVDWLLGLVTYAWWYFWSVLFALKSHMTYVY